MQPYVLIVDDFEDGREMLAEYLTFRGLRVVTATNGAEALAIVRRDPPAIVLMDLSMSPMDGWEATRHLKADPQTQDVIVVAVTAHALSHDEGKARQSGADAFVPKPFDLTALGDAIQRVMVEGRPALHCLSPAELLAQSKSTAARN